MLNCQSDIQLNLAPDRIQRGIPFQREGITSSIGSLSSIGRGSPAIELHVFLCCIPSLGIIGQSNHTALGSRLGVGAVCIGNSSLLTPGCLRSNIASQFNFFTGGVHRAINFPASKRHAFGLGEGASGQDVGGIGGVSIRFFSIVVGIKGDIILHRINGEDNIRIIYQLGHTTGVLGKCFHSKIICSRTIHRRQCCNLINFQMIVSCWNTAVSCIFQIKAFAHIQCICTLHLFMLLIKCNVIRIRYINGYRILRCVTIRIS